MKQNGFSEQPTITHEGTQHSKSILENETPVKLFSTCSQRNTHCQDGQIDVEEREELIHSCNRRE